MAQITILAVVLLSQDMLKLAAPASRTVGGLFQHPLCLKLAQQDSMSTVERERAGSALTFLDQGSLRPTVQLHLPTHTTNAPEITSLVPT